MEKIIFSLILILHGIVHLLYFGQSRRLFELKPGLTWPDGSWAFSKLPGDQATRRLANIALALAAIGFEAGAIGILTEQAWWHSVVVGTAIFSAVIFALLWNGKKQKLDAQGGVGILIDLAILAAVLIFQWPDFNF